MSPRAVAAWVLGAIVVALLTANPLYRVLVALIALNVVLRFRLPGRRLAPLLAAVGAAMAVAVLLNLLLAHTGRHVVVTVPDGIPAVGGPLTVESAAFGAVTALGLAAAVLASAALALLVEPEDVVGALPAALERTGTTVGAALALVPALGRSYRSVREAQLMRGWRPRGPRSWSDLVVPVVLTAVEDSIQLAEAMEARGFGAGPRTHFRAERWTAADALVAGSALVAALAFVGARLAGLAPDWYPYPTLTPPVAQPLLVAASLLLAAPLVAWNSRASTA